MTDFVIKDGVLIRYTGSSSEIEIPSGVTEIGDNALEFTGRLLLTGVTIPAGVKRIGNDAFKGCSALTSLTLPESVTEIGVSAFCSCTNLTQIVLPERMRYIRNWAFNRCSSLEAIHIPEGVKRVERCTFWGCTNLRTVTLPASVTKVGGQAFYGCVNLTKAVMLGRMQNVDCSAFEDNRPIIRAPNTPVSVFDRKDKPGAVLGLAEAYQDGEAMEESAFMESLKYIRSQRKRYYSKAIEYPALFRLMLAEKIIPKNDIERLLEECDAQGNTAAKAEVLEYACRNFKPVSPSRKFHL